VQEAKYDLVVMSDSDVRVDPDYLTGSRAAICRSPMLVRSPLLPMHYPPSQRRGGFRSTGMYLDSAPGALVARRLEGKMQFAFGWTMATTKRHLSEIGGWESMANYHSDDV